MILNLIVNQFYLMKYDLTEWCGVPPALTLSVVCSYQCCCVECVWRLASSLSAVCPSVPHSRLDSTQPRRAAAGLWRELQWLKHNVTHPFSHTHMHTHTRYTQDTQDTHKNLWSSEERFCYKLNRTGIGRNLSPVKEPSVWVNCVSLSEGLHLFPFSLN